VGGGQCNAQAVVGEHHHHLDVGTLRQQFGGAGVGDAGVVHHTLVHRAGDEAVELGARRRVGGLAQRRDHAGGVAPIQLPR
jgi:hypothetical protein